MPFPRQLERAVLMVCMAVWLAFGAGCESGGPQMVTGADQAWDDFQEKAIGIALVESLAGNQQATVANAMVADATGQMQGGLPLQASDELADEMAAALVRQVLEVPEIKQAKFKKLILVLGRFENKVGNYNPLLNDALDELAFNLSASAKLKERFVVVGGSRDKAIELLKAHSGDPAKFRELMVGDADVADYHPDAILHVSGKLFRRIEPSTIESSDLSNLTFDDLREARMKFIMTFEVTKPRTNEIVAAPRPATFVARYHPTLRQWISLDHDARLQREYEAYLASGDAARESAGMPSDYDDRDLPVALAWHRKQNEADWWNVAAMFSGSAELQQFAQSMKQDATRSMKSDLPLEAYEALVNRLADDLADEILQHPSVRNAKFKKLILVLGEPENAVYEGDDADLNPELDHAINSLRVRLATHAKLREKFRIIKGTREDSAKILKGFSGDPKVWEELGLSKTQQADYHPDAVVYLSVRLRRAFTHNLETASTIQTFSQARMQFLMRVYAWKPRTLEVLTYKRFVEEYPYHPFRQSWISMKENEQLQQKYEAALVPVPTEGDGDGGDADGAGDDQSAKGEGDASAEFPPRKSS